MSERENAIITVLGMVTSSDELSEFLYERNQNGEDWGVKIY